MRNTTGDQPASNGNNVTTMLPILDIQALEQCPYFDEDCQSMSVGDLQACRDHDYPKLVGVCCELQRRQSATA